MTLPRYSFIAIATILCALASPPAPAQPCLPSFPYQSGWLGGDAASSIPLSPARELWMFGDSFVSRPDKQTRVGSTMVANTIAISSCRSGKWSIDYHWTPPARRHRARAFFDSRTRAFRYWPLDGFLSGKTLYVALLRVVITDPANPFGFRVIGVDLARIANPDAEPARWSITYLPLSRSRAVYPGVSIVVLPPYAYLFGVLDRDGRKRHAVILTRISLDHLARPAESLEYLSDRSRGRQPPKSQPTSEAEHPQDQKSLDAGVTPAEYLSDASRGRQPPKTQPTSEAEHPQDQKSLGAGVTPAWKPAPIRDDAEDLVAEAAPDFSVRYHSEIAKWVMVQQDPGFPTTQIGIRTSAQLEGPWSPFRPLMNEPEMHPPTHPKHIFCYAAKEHPSFQPAPNTLLVTYVCNSLHFRNLINDMSIYHPIVTQLRIP